MGTHAGKAQGNKAQLFAKDISKKKGTSASFAQFEDNRPETIAQRKLQEAIPQIKQLRAYQVMANHNASQAMQRKENIVEEASPPFKTRRIKPDYLIV